MRLRHFGTLATILIFLPFCLFIATATDDVKNIENKQNNSVSASTQNVSVPSTSTTIISATTSTTSTSTSKPTVKGSTENHVIIEDGGLKKNVTYLDHKVKNVTVISSDSSSNNNSNKINNITPVNVTVPVNNQSSTNDSNALSSSSTTESPASSTTSKKPNVTTTAAPNEPILPEKGSAEAEHNSSMAIFFVLCVLAIGIVLIHFMLMTHFQYLPESVVIVFLGALIGLILNLMSDQNIGNWRKEEAFSPTAFFLVLLPPIIFESGYNLHKGNFFQNIGSILVFAIAGTTISALVIGAGIYLLGLAEVAYRLSFMESFAFGSLISAVDPVATVAIFHALDIDPVLNMLVFGESILNDAIAIVLTTSVFESGNPNMSSSEAVLAGINRFCLMFFASAGIGVVFALISALLLKHVDLRKNPSLEFGMMLVFTYAPYALAEGIHLSGIYLFFFRIVVKLLSLTFFIFVIHTDMKL